MNATKRIAIEAAGWKIGDTADFLEMGAEECRMLDAQVERALTIRPRQKALHRSQAELKSQNKPRKA